MFNFSGQVRGKIYESALRGWKSIPIAIDEPVRETKPDKVFFARSVRTVSLNG